MNKLPIVAALTLLWAASVFGQTTINLQVTDTPDNQTWNNGTWTVKLIPAPGNLSQTSTFTLTGGGSTANQSGSLSTTGAASFTLPANANIAPLSVWQFTVCSQAGTACSIANITVTTSSPQSVTISPPSIRVAAQPNLPPIVVYTTTEVASASIGSQITVVGSTPATPALQICTTISGSACTTWAATGGGAAWQNQGSTIGTPTTINCLTNLTCSFSSGTVTIVASSSASTAFSALTASANSNAGTFSASGNTWDFTATTLFKLRVGSGATTSANGDFAYDSLNAKWQIWQNGANKNLIAASNLGTSGQPCLSNADGSCTFADPVVSQPTAANLNAQVSGNAASGASDALNPVKIGGVFNTTQPTVTTGQRVDQQMSARGELFIAKGVSGFSIDNTGFNATQSGTWTVQPGNTANTTAWKVDGSAVTQPISAASLPLPTGAATSANQPSQLADNGQAAATNRLGGVIGIYRNDYHGGTAATAGRDAGPDVGTDGLVHVTALPDLSLKRYKASSKFAASSTTDNWRISGNASNTVVVTKLVVTCTQTTAGIVTLELRKESAAISGGTPTTVTNLPVDSNKAAASSVVQSFTGTGPTVGTLVADLDNAQFGCNAPTTPGPNDIYIPPVSTAAPIAVLRGTAEGIAINFGGAITGGTLTVTIEWTEVTTITP